MSFPNVIYGNYGDEKVTAASAIGGLPLGQEMILPDSREFVHSQVGATALVPGKLYEGQAVLAGTGWANDIAVLAGSAEAGATTLTMTASGTTAITADQFAGGFLFVASSTGTGVGWQYKIKSHAAAATTVSLTALQSAGTIEEGEQFTIENHRRIYTVNADAAIASSTAAITFYPPLEAAVASTAWVISFLKSSLTPRDEELFADMVAGNLAISKAPKFFNTIPVGGGEVWSKFLSWGERRLAEVIGKLRRDNPPQTKRKWPTE